MGLKESIHWCLENLDTCKAAVPKLYREDLYDKTVEGVRETFSELQDKIAQAEKTLIVRDNRIKAMYAGDLSPESRLKGYEAIIEAMKKSSPGFYTTICTDYYDQLQAKGKKK